LELLNVVIFGNGDGTEIAELGEIDHVERSAEGRV
jgi:hypothetical protein